jgi:AraC family transcriptional regulator, positive regulator of tynA and feaB
MSLIRQCKPSYLEAHWLCRHACDRLPIMTTQNLWSTGDTEPRLRFSYWRDAVCQAILNVDAERRGSESFEARISSFAGGMTKVARFASQPHRIVRSRGHVRRSGEGGYLVSWQESGRSRIVQGDSSVLLETGDIGIVDVERPFQVDFPNPVSRTLMLIPRRMLEERAPWLRRSLPIKAGGESIFAELAGAHLAQLCTGSVIHSAADLLVENICNLLALSTIPASFQRETCELPTETLLTFLRRNLHRPELSPPMAAAHLRISVRTLHLRFQRMGTTFGAWVLAERLEACRGALDNGMLNRQSISEIAFDWGFRELSHFSRVFKARYGISPRDYRAARRGEH